MEEKIGVVTDYLNRLGVGSVMGEDTVEAPAAHRCLEPCPRCRAAKFSGGACHLPSGQTGSHECRAVSGEIHRWR